MPARRLRFWENLWPYAPLTFGLGWFLWSRIVIAAHEALGRSSRGAVCRARGIVFSLFAVPLSWSLSWHECSHVRVLYVFPIGVPVFVSGDHCGNAKDAQTVWDQVAGREGTRSY